VTAKICNRSGNIYRPPARCECPQCQAYRKRDDAIRGRNLYTSGRRTAHWQRLRKQAIERDRVCQYPGCGTDKKLTVHLNPAMRGQHADATLADVITYCRTHHGKVDGKRSTGNRR
jgi:hypothetical protein